MQQVNFVFVRHGHGCHNATKGLIQKNVISKLRYLSVDRSRFVDPELTPIGVDATIKNGCVVANVLQEKLGIPYMNMVMCSPLIRSMETAYFMTRLWGNAPRKIYVMPHLRECDESTHDIFSSESRELLDNVPEYAMKDLVEQKAYLKQKGILEYFDFSFVEKFAADRKSPGHIHSFINFFIQHVMSRFTSRVPQPLNVMVVTHHGVLRYYSDESFYNNSGFALFTTVKNDRFTVKKSESLSKHLSSSFFKNYNNKELLNSEYYCPSQRCAQICHLAKNEKNAKLKRVDLGDCKTDLSFESFDRKVSLNVDTNAAVGWGLTSNDLTSESNESLSDEIDTDLALAFGLISPYRASKTQEYYPKSK